MCRFHPPTKKPSFLLEQKMILQFLHYLFLSHISFFSIVQIFSLIFLITYQQRHWLIHEMEQLSHLMFHSAQKILFEVLAYELIQHFLPFLASNNLWLYKFLNHLYSDYILIRQVFCYFHHLSKFSYVLLKTL